MYMKRQKQLDDVVQEYMNYCDRSDKDAVLLTSSCSAINNLIEKYHPDMLPYLLPVVTPAIAHARMLRAQYGPDVKIIYISPCVSDGGDALKDPRTKGIIDAVLDFATLRDWLRSEQIKIPKCPSSHMDSMDPKVMRLFAVSGGILSAIKLQKAVSTSISDCMSAVLDPVKNFLNVSVMERSRTVLLSSIHVPAAASTDR